MNAELRGIKIDIEYGDIIECFSENVKKHPTKVALISGKNYSYQDVDVMSNKIANFLYKKGVREKQVIGILVEKNEYFIGIILAILKLNAICFIIDKKLGDNKVDYTMKDAGVSYLIKNKQDGNKKTYDNVILFDENAYINEKPIYLHSVGKLEQTAFIFYTSGTTGGLKKISISHGNVLNDTSSKTARPELFESDVFLLTSPKASLRITGEIFYPLYAGATIVMMSDSSAKDRDAIIHSIIKNNVTVFFAVPTMLKELINANEISNCNSLRMVQSLGEMLSKEMIYDFYNSLDAELYNIYGQTEAGMCTTHKIEMTDRNVVYCGKPVPNRTIYIVNDEGEIAKIGELGYIYISGKYLNYDETYDDDCILFNSEKAYKTGDCGIVDNTYRLIHCGRNDSICKVNGVRINLNDIEQICAMHSSIEKVVSILYDDGKRKFIVIVYEKKDEENKVIHNDLDCMLRRALPVYILPSRYLCIDRMPLGNTGKIDRNRVREYVNQQIKHVNNNDVNDITKAIANILKIDLVDIDVKKTLYENGMNSLQIIEFQVVYENIYNTTIELKKLKNMCIEEMY